MIPTENLAQKNFMNETYLTTTKSSEITRTDSMDDPVEFKSAAAEPAPVAEVKVACVNPKPKNYKLF